MRAREFFRCRQTVRIVVVCAFLALAATGCGSARHGKAGGSSGTGRLNNSDQATTVLDMQAVEGCFNGGGQNTDEPPTYLWFDLVDLGGQATNVGLGAFSTFAGDEFDNSAFYFFNSHDQAEQMLKKANLDAHGAQVKVVGNAIVAQYSDLSPADQQLQNRCLS